MMASSRLRRCARLALCLIALAIGFAGTCWAIRAALPFREVPMVFGKVDYLARHHDEFDTLFIGSSRIYYQIIPSVFDKIAAEEGLPTRSFNAGVAGMRPPEDAYMLDYILRTPPKNLRWVFIELGGLRTAVDPEKFDTIRAVYWHDFPRLSLLWQRALILKNPKKKRRLKKWLQEMREPLGDFYDHLTLFLRNTTNIGRGAMITDQLIAPRPWTRGDNIGSIGKARDGWVRTGRPEEMQPKQRAEFEEQLTERRAKPALPDTADPVSQKALEIMIARIEKLGSRVVLIVPPTTAKRNFYPSKQRQAKTMVLDFSDLQRYPELYENRYRLDTDHVNTSGAEVFTRDLAKAWAAEVKKQSR